MARSFGSALVLCIVLCLVLAPVALADVPGPQGAVAPAEAAGPASTTGPTGGGCPGTLAKTYSGWEFRTLRANTAVEYASSGAIYRTAGDDFIDLPVDLSQGAQIIAINFYYLDNLPTEMEFWLSRYTPWTGGYSNLTHVHSSGASASVRTAVLAAATACAPLATVDSTVNRYALEVKFGAAHLDARLFGAAVIYTVPTMYLPLVLR